MIELYYAATPNGLKVRIFLEEAGLSYLIVPVNLSKGEQSRPEFVAIAPRNCARLLAAAWGSMALMHLLAAA